MNDSLNVEWKRLINPSSGEKSFYIEKRPTWGNKIWVGKKTLIIIIITCIIVLTLRITFDFPDHALVGEDSNGTTSDQPDPAIDDLEYIGEVPYLIFLMIPFIALATILFKLPSFDDNIFIAKEMKMVIFVLLFILIAFAVQEIVEDVIGDKRRDGENLNIALNIGYYAVIETCNFFCIMITTKYVMDKVKVLLREQRQSQYLGNSSVNPQQPLTSEMADYVQLQENLLELQTSKSNSKKSLNNVSNMTDDPEDELDDEWVGSVITLNQILSHPKAFDLFVHHIAKEFSIECLLSYVEFVQFKQYMFKHMKIMRSENDIRQKSLELYKNIESGKGSLSKSEIEIDINYGSAHNQDRSMSFQDVKFPSTVPKSSIVYEDDINFESNNFKERSKYKIYKLYMKYIKTGCELEINISHRSRQALVKMIDDYDKWMNDNKYKNLDQVFLMHIFDKVIAQMRNLLSSSYMRFKHSNQFTKLSQFVFV